jgi:hypothetical protein
MVRRRDNEGSLWTVGRSAGVSVMMEMTGQGGGAVKTNKTCLRMRNAMAADGRGQDEEATCQKQLATG